MADLDNESKRHSHMRLIKPYSPCIPRPDSTIDQADRQHLAWLYSGILATPVGGAAERNFLTLLGVGA